MSVPVLSRSLIACRSVPRETKLSRSREPAAHARQAVPPGRGTAAKRARPAAPSLPSPTDPTLRANPFPEVTDLFCRLPLPTLFYRPEAVHLGDLLRIRVRPGVKITLPSSDFQGPTPMHRTPREARRFTDATSLSLDKPIPGSPLLTKKRELFPGSTLASPSSVALPHWGPRAQSPLPGSGILTRFPFDRIGGCLPRARGTPLTVLSLSAFTVQTAATRRASPVQNGIFRSLRAD